MIHPCGEAAIVAIGVPIFQHPLENGLSDVLRGGSMSGELDEEPKERSVMPLEELTECVELAVAYGQHQGVIGAFFGGRFHGE